MLCFQYGEDRPTRSAGCRSQSARSDARHRRPTSSAWRHRDIAAAKAASGTTACGAPVDKLIERSWRRSAWCRAAGVTKVWSFASVSRHWRPFVRPRSPVSGNKPRGRDARGGSQTGPRRHGGVSTASARSGGGVVALCSGAWACRPARQPLAVKRATPSSVSRAARGRRPARPRYARVSPYSDQAGRLCARCIFRCEAGRPAWRDAARRDIVRPTFDAPGRYTIRLVNRS